MRKDNRYKIVKEYYEQGNILTFYEIFKMIPKTIVARDLDIKISIFSSLIRYLHKFRIEQIFKIASLFEIDEFSLVYMVYYQYKINEQNKKR